MVDSLVIFSQFGPDANYLHPITYRNSQLAIVTYYTILFSIFFDFRSLAMKRKTKKQKIACIQVLVMHSVNLTHYFMIGILLEINKQENNLSVL